MSRFPSLLQDAYLPEDVASNHAIALARKIYQHHLSDPRAESFFNVGKKKRRAIDIAMEAYNYYFHLLTNRKHSITRSQSQVYSAILNDQPCSAATTAAFTQKSDLALTMARRVYFSELFKTHHSRHLTRRSYSAPNLRQTPIDLAHKAFCSYQDVLGYRHKNKAKSLSPAQLEAQLALTDLNHATLDSVLHADHYEANYHPHQVIKKTEQQSVQMALQGYQQAVHNGQTPKQAGDAAYKLYEGCHHTTHQKLKFTAPDKSRKQLKTSIEQHQYQNVAISKPVKKAWKLGYRLGNLAGYCASMVAYGFSKLFCRSRSKQLTKPNQSSWRQRAGNAMGRTVAAITWAFVALPQIFKRPTLGRDTTSKTLYEIYDTISDHRGRIHPNYTNYVERLLLNITVHAPHNKMHLSRRCTRLLQILNGENQQHSLSDKMQHLIAYMTSKTASKSALKSAKHYIWLNPRERKLVGGFRPDNAHMDLYRLIENQARRIELKASSLHEQPEHQQRPGRRALSY